MKLKFVANVISILRVLLSLSLLFVDLFTWVFVLIYLLCGISDVLDGYIARRTKTQSAFGAKLDTVADMVMFAVIMLIFIPVITLSNTLIIWLLVIVSIRILSMIIVYFKYKMFAMLHTLSNKVAGILIFFIPIVIGSSLETPFIYFVFFIASVSAIEELVINILSKKMEVNIKSIFRMYKNEFKRLLKKIKNYAHESKRDVAMLFFACKRKDIPWYSKIIPVLVVGYFLSPIDLIPDFIPILGYLDDLIIIPLGIALAIRLIPKKILMECKIEADESLMEGKPKNWIAGAVIIIIWVLLVTLVVLKIYGV